MSWSCILSQHCTCLVGLFLNKILPIKKKYSLLEIILTIFSLNLDLPVHSIKAVHSSNGMRKYNYILIIMHFVDKQLFNLLSFPITLDISLVTICIWDFYGKLSSNNIPRTISYLPWVFELLREIVPVHCYCHYAK